ncbi:hypothetical protein BJV82DRAFT_611304 [Fennellomyces sp. T-0311]|nr:hypothetical protein BJV82DRAFT_611304 [Fennellomyces sp. T-0311]
MKAIKTPEPDLCASFLNVILAPLFTNKNQRLQGPNAKLDVGQSKSSDGHATTSRPDTAVVELQGVHAGATKVFGEVKAAHITNDTYLLSEDLLRFGVFAKGAIDNDQLSTVLTFQAVGLKITFFAVTLIGDGMYAMVELEKITIPNCINDVSSFLGCVQPLMNILSVMKSCIPSPFPNELKDMGRPTLSTPEFRSLINKSRDRKRISYINYT